MALCAPRPNRTLKPLPPIDWPRLKSMAGDLARIVERDLGPPDKGSRWWCCAFHDDRNPSMKVYPDGFRCFSCGAQGDVIDWYMRRENLTRPQAAKRIDPSLVIADDLDAFRPHPRPKPQTVAKPAPRPEPGPEGMDAHEAAALVEGAADRLWSNEGAEALAYLQGRGLEPETIRAARLGVVTRGRPGLPAGVLIPWHESGRLSLVKIRTASGKPKYREVYRDRPGLFVAHPILPGRPCLIAEGELDAILLGQETAYWSCAVVTTGSASNRPDAALAGKLLPAWPWLIATDADEAGDKIAAAWMGLAPARCQRLRPPGSGKDWTDWHAEGSTLIRHRLAPLLMTPPSWDDLAALRWGDEPEADVL